MKHGSDLEKDGASPPKASGFPVTTIALGAVCVALILSLAFLVKTCWRAPADAVREVAEAPGKGAAQLVNAALLLADGLKARLNFAPKVIQDTHVLVHETTPILELATVTRRLTVEMGYTNIWMGSSKSLRLRGTFLAKGGFDLKKNSEIKILTDQKKIIATFPKSELLSVEMVSHEVLWSEDGYWNKLKPEDQKVVMDQLYARAKLDAASTVRREAAQELEKTIFDLAKTTGTDVEIRYESKGQKPQVIKSPRG